MDAKQTPLVDLLRLHAEDLHSAHGHNQSSRLLSQAADEIDRLKLNLVALEDEKNTYIDYVGGARNRKGFLASCRRLSRIMCAVSGHHYVVQRVFSPTSRKIGCLRCGMEWGMNDRVRLIVPWDGELEELYRLTGQWPGIPIESAALAAKGE